jgi:hypothetical protein
MPYVKPDGIGQVCVDNGRDERAGAGQCNVVWQNASKALIWPVLVTRDIYRKPIHKPLQRPEKSLNGIGIH